MTRRERLEGKLQKRQEWAESRRKKSAVEFEKSDLREEKSGIPFGQPILVGHHSEGRHRNMIKRANNAMRKSIEHDDMAKNHAYKAAGIKSLLKNAIFSDDVDAVEALETKIADLETERNAIKSYNKSARAAGKQGEKFGDLSLLPDGYKDKLISIKTVCPYDEKPGMPFPAYVLSNLSANIKRSKDRLNAVKIRQARAKRAEQSESGVIIEGDDYIAVTFSEYPGREIINDLKAALFHYSNGSWRGTRAKLPECINE